MKTSPKTQIVKDLNKKNITDRKSSRLPALWKRYTIEQIADAIKRNWGALTYCCLDLDCTIQQFLGCLAKFPELDELRKEMREKTIDLAEKAMIHNLEQDNLNAAIYTLKTLGSNRGWSEKQNIEITMTQDEQKKKIAEIFGINQE